MSGTAPRGPVPGPDRLEGRLVRLEPLGPAHVPGLVAAAGEDRSPYRYAFVPDGPEAVADYVARAEAGRRDGSMVPFATVRVADGAVVGTSRFAFLEWWPWPPGHPRAGRASPDAVEIGYSWLAASALGRGYNVEAKLLMLAHAFDRWGVARVRLRTDRRNRRSWAAIEALGARFDGVLRADHAGADGTVRDSAYFSVLAGEWPAVRRRLERRLAGRPATGSRSQPG